MGNEANKRKDQIKDDMMQSLIKAHSIKGHKKKMDMTGQDVYDIIKDKKGNVKDAYIRFNKVFVIIIKHIT